MASWTRFSPKIVWPPMAMVGQTSSAENVLETATNVTAAGSRPQSRARVAIAARKSASRAAAPSESATAFMNLTPHA